MGFGKLAISLVMVGILAFAFIAVATMAHNDMSTDAPYIDGSNLNKTIAMVDTVNGASANLMTPLLIISGILFLLGAFLILRKAS